MKVLKIDLVNFCLLSALLVLSSAIASPLTNVQKRSPADYAPKAATCPSTPLLRSATGVNDAEASYVKARKSIASKALAKWLKATCDYSMDTSKYPTLAFVNSGGGYRAFLTDAGVHQAFDERETNVKSSMKGLYQAMTYESSLSGGAWLLASIMGNDWPTISSLKKSLWYKTLPATPFEPTELGKAISNQDFVALLSAKHQAGYDPTVVDVFGRLAAYTTLEEAEGGVKQTLSSIRQMSSYSKHTVPFPIITVLEVTELQKCGPNLNATQYEFTPVEFGSWDKERAAFLPTEYTGSIIGSDGSQNCVTGYDNLGYIMGTTGDILAESCNPTLAAGVSGFAYFFNYSETLLAGAGHTMGLRDVYAPFPNTFSKQTDVASAYAPTGKSAFSELYLLDGGESGQGNPIWPFLYRDDVDVLFVVDANQSPDTNGYPNGADMRTTYLQSLDRGLGRMPHITDSTAFVKRGYNARPTFFGCDEPNAMTIIYLPNVDYVYPSNTSAFKLSYTQAEIDGMLSNGQAVGTFNNQKDFAKCVGCAVMKKTKTQLPPGCDACFAQYCALPPPPM